MYYTVSIMEFQEKRKVKRILYSKVTLVILAIVIVVLVNSVWGVYKKRALSKENLEKTQASLEILQAREKLLSAEIERLKSATGVEEEIREKFGLVKPGEEVIIIVDNDSQVSTSTSTRNRSFWQKMIEWFK